MRNSRSNWHLGTGLKPLVKRKEQLQHDHQKARNAQKAAHEKRQNDEREKRQAEFRKGFKGVFDWITGKSRNLKRRHHMMQFAADNRDWDEKEALIHAQLAEQEELQKQLRVLKDRQQKELMALNTDFVKGIKQESTEVKHSFNVIEPIDKQQPQIIDQPDIRI